MLPLIILFGSLVAVIALKFKEQKEGFAGLNFPMSFRPDGEVKSGLGSNFYSVPGTYQASLAPRFSNLDYGSQINFNFPPEKYLATPNNPLSYKTQFGDIPKIPIKENFCSAPQSNYQGPPPNFQFGDQTLGTLPSLPDENIMRENFCKIPAGYQGPPPNFQFGDQTKNTLPSLPSMNSNMPTRDGQFIKESFTTPVRCNTDRQPQQKFVSQAPYYSGYTTPPDFTTTNYANEYDQLAGSTFSSILPAGEVKIVNKDGSVEQPIIYDRFIFANQRSRLQGLGDRIRGDLPILPNNSGWFQVPVNPTIDLTNSALGVMSGFGDTAKDLTALKTAIAMNTLNTWGSMGNIDNSVQKQMMGSAANSDIQVTTFP